MEEKEAYYNGEGLPVLPTVEVNEEGIPIVRLNFDLYHLNSGCITGDDVYDYLEESQGVLFFGLSDRATVNNPFQGIAFDCVPTSDDGELSGALDNFLSSDKTTAEQTLENGLLMWVYNFDLPDEMVDEYSDEDEDWHYDMGEKALKAINLIFGIPKNYNYDGPEAIFDLKVATLDDSKIDNGYHHRFHVYKENGEWTSKELPLD